MIDVTLARLREPSTYAGFAAIFGAYGFDMTALPWWNQAVAFVIAGAGLASILMRENTKTGA